jgi:excinuclease ABC subunit B
MQTAGRTARNVHGKVIMYADKITESMKKTIDETDRRRAIQMEYNKEHGISPQTIYKSRDEILSSTSIADVRKKDTKREPEFAKVADPVVKYMTNDQKKDLIEQMREEMLNAAKDMEFEKAATLRDEIERLENMVKDK